LGPTLTEFKSFTESFPPDLKGEAIGASEELKKAHNSFARKDAFLSEGKTHFATGTEDVFHFVAYIPHSNKVYELDGLQSGPIVIGDYEDDWMTVARSAIQERMTTLDGEIKFNLMAIIKDKRVGLEDKLASIEDKESADYHEVQAELQQEHAKRHQWKVENQRRRHNYLPLCIALLKELARKGSLPQLTTEAQERVQVKRAKAMQK
jgi:ubiquitin carboxyl-terminal hydrolase L5